MKDKDNKTPFPVTAGIANAVHTTGLMDMGIMLYPGTGTMDGVDGDHVLVSPIYTSTKEDAVRIVKRIKETVDMTFAKV